jgi:proteasome accessory factor C
VSPPELAGSARQAAREALAAYDGIEDVAAHGAEQAQETAAGRAVPEGPDTGHDRQEREL